MISEGAACWNPSLMRQVDESFGYMLSSFLTAKRGRGLSLSKDDRDTRVGRMSSDS